jgi:hypothetical protein
MTICMSLGLVLILTLSGLLIKTILVLLDGLLLDSLSLALASGLLGGGGAVNVAVAGGGGIDLALGGTALLLLGALGRRGGGGVIVIIIIIIIIIIITIDLTGESGELSLDREPADASALGVAVAGGLGKLLKVDLGEEGECSVLGMELESSKAWEPSPSLMATRVQIAESRPHGNERQSKHTWGSFLKQRKAVAIIWASRGLKVSALPSSLPALVFEAAIAKGAAGWMLVGSGVVLGGWSRKA